RSSDSCWISCAIAYPCKWPLINTLRISMSSVPGNRSALFFSVPIDGLIMLLGIFGLVSKESYFFYSGSLFEQTGVRQGTRRVSFWLPKSFWTKVSGLRSLPDAQGRWRKGLA